MPTEPAFIIKFMKGLSNHKNLYNPVQKAYPISYSELEQLFYSVCNGQKFCKTSFIKQRFICMLMLAFGSFTRFEEIQFLLVEQIVLIDQDFSVQFRKGKAYLEARYGVIPFFSEKNFNPAGVLSFI